MSRFPRITRLAAAGALVLSTLVVAGIAPVDATVAPTGAPAPATASGSFTDNGNGTVTVTYAGFSPLVFLYASGTTCDNTGFPPNPLFQIDSSFGLTASPMTIGTTTTVYSYASPAAPPGSPLPAGTYAFCLYSYAGPITGSILVADGGSMSIDQAPITASMVDNGNGSLTVTYANATDSQYFYLFLLADATTCPADISPSFVGFGFQSDINMTASPMTIGVGTPALKAPPVTLEPTPITAGNYAACLYYAVDSTMALRQTLPIGIGIAPTPPAPPTPPAFTG